MIQWFIIYIQHPVLIIINTLLSPHHPSSPSHTHFPSSTLNLFSIMKSHLWVVSLPPLFLFPFPYVHLFSLLNSRNVAYLTQNHGFPILLRSTFAWSRALSGLPLLAIEDSSHHTQSSPSRSILAFFLLASLTCHAPPQGVLVLSSFFPPLGPFAHVTLNISSNPSSFIIAPENTALGTQSHRSPST